MLLKGLVEAVLRGGEGVPSLPSTTDSADVGHDGEPSDVHGGDDDDGDGDNDLGPGSGRASGRLVGVASAAATANATVVAVPVLGHAWCGGSGGGTAWEGLAAPAARLWAACRPSDPAQLDVLDKVLGEIFFIFCGHGRRF